MLKYVGAAFLPTWGIDIDLAIGQGFQAKVSSNSVLEIIGTQLMPELTPIELDLGWNMIAYLREEPADVVLVFQEIQENVTIVKDGLGNVYFPTGTFVILQPWFLEKAISLKCLLLIRLSIYQMMKNISLLIFK